MEKRGQHGLYDLERDKSTHPPLLFNMMLKILTKVIREDGSAGNWAYCQAGGPDFDCGTNMADGANDFPKL